MCICEPSHDIEMNGPQVNNSHITQSHACKGERERESWRETKQDTEARVTIFRKLIYIYIVD